ncbi:MAG: hypothetical protein KDJ14_07450 [Xanthomonadales bacterium]|nr:hypothetical protein [Xanthomonadales bacterium]
MSEILLDLLISGGLATSVAILSVLLLRPLVHLCLGARPVYALWTLVPAALMGALLPARVLHQELATEAPSIVHSVGDLAGADPVPPFPMSGLPAAPAPTNGIGTSVEAGWGLVSSPALLTAIWLLGVVVFVGIAMRRQWRFTRDLGPLSAAGEPGALTARHVPAPMVMGLWAPRILLPIDFHQRFTPTQRALVLEHERVHLARRDLVANALATALCSIFWFNPLMHLARRLFLRDQEWACDVLVLERFPNQRRAYAEALLSVHAVVPGLPVACAWQSSQPLVRRIRMIRNASLSPRMAGWGNAAALVLGLAALPLAWAAKPERIEWVDAAIPSRDASRAAAVRVSAGPVAWPKSAPEMVPVAQDASPAGSEARSMPEPLPLPELSNAQVSMQLASLQSGSSPDLHRVELAGSQANDQEQLPLVMEPTLLRTYQPRWPSGVKFKNFRSAAVLVEHSVTPDGQVVDVVVLDSTDPRLNDLAISSVKRAKFASIEGIGRYPAGMRVRQAVVWQNETYGSNGVDPVGPPRLNRGHGVATHVEANAGRGR